jgi:TonB family protein
MKFISTSAFGLCIYSLLCVPVLAVCDSTSQKSFATSTSPTLILPGMSKPILIKKVEPKYPNNAKAKRIEGVVVLTAIIDKQGHVSDLHVVSGRGVLAEEALGAVKQWEYRPYRIKGEAVECETTITVTFALDHHIKKE